MNSVRLQLSHCDYLKWEVKKRSKSSLVEDIDRKDGYTSDVLVVFVAAEGVDQKNPESVVEETVESIVDVSEKIGAGRIVLFPFVHLFPESLPPAEFAYNCLLKISDGLKKKGLEAERVPFGWYKMHELRCKGHPLSQLSRTIRVGQDELNKVMEAKG
ncbi:MAG: threonyl-tRNA synthetase editing domain-containing protein [Halobacteriota archaeon]|nr:threonyl-tRNA synthetase editing domain-containing protein [Halobacteriota archaeon]